MYVNCAACVTVLGGKSDWFKVEQGARRGWAGLCEDVPMAR